MQGNYALWDDGSLWFYVGIDGEKKMEMSASLHWTPAVSRRVRNVNSGVIDTLSRAFGSDGFELYRSHLDVLRGMDFTWHEPVVSPYEQLMDAILEHGSITVWIGS